MRQSHLALALAAALGTLAPFHAIAQDSGELAQLKAQLAALQAKVAELETRTDAQSDINVDTRQTIDKMVATAPKVETKGGLKVTSADKKFEASLGGRIHFDAYAFDRDLAATTGTSEFRRARLSLSGKALGWDYKLEQDFAAGSNLDGLRDAYIATGLWGGKVTIGHFKPYRSMEELTSSNDLLMMERPFASATGLFAGRQFQQGVGYQRAGENYTAGFTVFNLRGASGSRNEGMGAAVPAAPASAAGRRGPSQAIATTTGASRNTVTAYGLEAAGAFGPLFFQGEYVNAVFGQPIGGDQDVTTWYLQGSWLINGGHK